jgi:hypothetical protein
MWLLHIAQFAEKPEDAIKYRQALSVMNTHFTGVDGCNDQRPLMPLTPRWR